MRLNKYIAHAGITSRRKADELIAAGKVRVSGRVVTELGFDVDEGGGVAVEVDGQPILPAAKLSYIALNKPKGYITTTSDERGRATVMELVSGAGGRLFPVGRLDGPTTGLLLLTNDGDFAYRLTHPKHELVKTYLARVTGAMTEAKLRRLRNGVDIGGYVTKPAVIEIVKAGEHSLLVEVRIHEGKNRQVRKMFAAVGCRVTELERTAIGDVRLGNLLPGHWRKLTSREVASL